VNNLIVYAHPDTASFNHAIMDAYVLELKASGHKVRIRDLYALGFDPVITLSDYEMIDSGDPPEDIKAEQEHISWAGVVSFICPIFWAGMPAVLKGYVDKVFSLGFAYSFQGDRPKGLLRGKKAVILNSTGGSLVYHQKSGMLDSIRKTIDGGIFRFCGIEVLEHRFFMGVPIATPAEREKMLSEVRDIARSLPSK
jgi:NAD(P)H dehydrogenase (quinone)